MKTYQYFNGQPAFFKLDNGEILELIQDEYAESPREWDNLGTLSIASDIHIHEGDLQNIDDFLSHYKVKQSGYDKAALMRDIDSIQEAAKKQGGVCLPVSAYDHSGITFYIGKPTAQWDNYLAGFIYVSAETIREAYGRKRVTAKLRDRVEQVLANEIADFDDWANGNCWGYRVYDRNGEEVDSCYGFIGDDALDWIADECGGKIVKFLGNFDTIEDCLEETERED